MQIRKNRKTLYFFITIILVVILHYAGALSAPEGWLVRALSPALSLAQRSGSAIKGFYLSQTGRQDLAGRVLLLEAENGRLLAENAGLKIAETENRILRGQLKFLSDQGLAYATANVISRGTLARGDSGVSITIDRGRRDGIVEGMAVVAGEGMVVGKVSEAREQSALVSLVTNGDCRLAAMVLSADGTSGIAEGELGLSIRMGFIPQSVELKPGDPVVTSGLEEAVPRGLVIGRVASIEKEANELWQSAVIEPLVDLEQLLIVSVVKPNN